MTREVPPNKRSDYFDIKINGIGGRSDDDYKAVVIGNHMEYLAKQCRKTKMTTHKGE